jgi:hypothetical protein
LINPCADTRFYNLSFLRCVDRDTMSLPNATAEYYRSGSCGNADENGRMTNAAPGPAGRGKVNVAMLLRAREPRPAGCDLSF